MKGKIIKAVSGAFYVHVDGKGVFSCSARGIFRYKKIKPLIGDNVKIEVTHEEDKEGNILEILPRKNSLIRPTVANIDQAFIVFSITEPAPNINLLDRFLVVIAKNNIDAVVCFNKADLSDEENINRLKNIYEQAGYKTIITSTYEDINLEEVKKVFDGKTTVFAGPSGVGKSSIINIIQSYTHMETGVVSNKIKRGKHTTRHAELLPVKESTYVVDTPGFSSLELTNITKDSLKDYFIEFDNYLGECKFADCNHINEPKCEVKRALEEGKISESRYKSYIQLYEELKDIKKY